MEYTEGEVWGLVLNADLAVFALFAAAMVFLAWCFYRANFDEAFELERYLASGGDKFDEDAFRRFSFARKVFMNCVITLAVAAVVGAYLYYVFAYIVK